MTSVLRPKALKPGDLVAVAALSSGLEEEKETAQLLSAGVDALKALALRVRVSPLLKPGQAWWWGAARPSEMAAELNSLFSDREVRAIFAFTGGRMTLSYLDLIDYDAILADPKPLVGFSDISGLAFAIHARTGLAAVHGDLVAHGVADWRDLGDAGRALSDVYRRVLMEVAPAGVLPRRGEWECWRQGRVEGPLIGGLLNRIIKLQSTAYRLEGRHFNGAILFWEDLGTTFSGVWNDLQALRQAGLLDRIAGMIVGPLSTIGRDEAGPASLREVVLEVLGDRPIPVIANVNIGHDPPNVPLPLGINARIDAAELSVSLTEAAVI